MAIYTPVYLPTTAAVPNTTPNPYASANPSATVALVNRIADFMDEDGTDGIYYLDYPELPDASDCGNFSWYQPQTTVPGATVMLSSPNSPDTLVDTDRRLPSRMAILGSRDYNLLPESLCDLSCDTPTLPQRARSHMVK